MERHPNILNAATNLLGICFVVITGLSISRSNGRSFADETAWVAAVCFLLATLLSYLAIRRQNPDGWAALWADRLFLTGVLALTLATVAVGWAFR